MLWNNEKIYEYYSYQAKDGYGKDAIRTLAGINKCAVAEIEEIIKEVKKQKMAEEKISKEEKEAIMADYAAGMSVKELVAKYNCNAPAMYKRLQNWKKSGKKPAKDNHIEKELAPAEKKTPAETVLETLSGKAEQQQEEKAVPLGKLTPVQRLGLLKGFIDTVRDRHRIEITGIHADSAENVSRLTITSCGCGEYVLELRRK